MGFGEAGDDRVFDVLKMIDMLLVLSMVVGIRNPKCFFFGKHFNRSLNLAKLSRGYVRAPEITQGKVDALLNWYVRSSGRKAQFANRTKGEFKDDLTGYKAETKKKILAARTKWRATDMKVGFQKSLRETGCR